MAVSAVLSEGAMIKVGMTRDVRDVPNNQGDPDA